MTPTATRGRPALGEDGFWFAWEAVAKWLDEEEPHAVSAQDPSPRKSRRSLAVTVRLMMLLTLVLASGLEHIAGLTELRDLDLSYCPNITNTGLRHLRTLRKLRRLNQDETWVSEAEVTAATAATPGLLISRRGRPLF